MIASAEVRIAVGERGDVSGLLLKPEGARLLYVLAHGAGAGMRHPFLESMAGRPPGGGNAPPREPVPHQGTRPPPPHPPPVARTTGRAAGGGGGRGTPRRAAAPRG